MAEKQPTHIVSNQLRFMLTSQHKRRVRRDEMQGFASSGANTGSMRKAWGGFLTNVMCHSHPAVVEDKSLEVFDHFASIACRQRIVDLRVDAFSNSANRTVAECELAQSGMWGRESFVVTIELIRAKLCFK